MSCLAEITGRGKPTVHSILKSDWKMSKASARWVPRILSEDDCGHNPASYNCKLSNVITNLNDVRRWVRPKAGKISAHTLLFDIFLQHVHEYAKIMEEFTMKI